jgi:hypothetical protein
LAFGLGIHRCLEQRLGLAAFCGESEISGPNRPTS